MKQQLSKLQKLQAQKAKIDARIQMISAREKTKERKQDTRRKILIGAYYFDKAKENNSMPEINKIMDGYLTRKSDRELFGLKALDKEKKK